MADGVSGSSFAPVVALLEHNRRAAGAPSYQEIEDISADLAKIGRPVHGIFVCRVPHSTAHDLFRKSSRRIPRWELLESLWATLYRYAEIRGRETDLMFSWADLERSYKEAQNAPDDPVERAHRRAAPVPAPEDGPDAGPGDVELRGPMDWHSCLAGSPSPGGGVAGSDGPAETRLREVDEEFVAELQKRGGRTLVQAYRDVIPDWFELYVLAEPELAEIRAYAPLRVPGLLQTGEYARLVIAHDLRGIPEPELRRRVDLRLSRQDVLYRPGGPRVWVIMHERALRDDLGSPAVLRAQIRHLIGLAGYADITLQVIPARETGRPFVDGPLTVMRFPEAHINDMIFLEFPGYGLYLRHRRDTLFFCEHFATFMIGALSPDESIRFLHGLL
ncbi:DUF5753 domain-containing protein [Actinomadura sp. WMMA1423]|uniref:DUF5753 domain-containing protein n=1 Tax=Actinomadura sp. WMMA1423 TaxID=2591108 RepID=UPI0011475C2C|nr:DUF5753 domain-containing protein [Actinomadura sp. WMMA1423]